MIKIKITGNKPTPDDVNLLVNSDINSQPPSKGRQKERKSNATIITTSIGGILIFLGIIGVSMLHPLGFISLIGAIAFFLGGFIWRYNVSKSSIVLLTNLEDAHNYFWINCIFGITENNKISFFSPKELAVDVWRIIPDCLKNRYSLEIIEKFITDLQLIILNEKNHHLKNNEIAKRYEEKKNKSKIKPPIELIKISSKIINIKNNVDGYNELIQCASQIKIEYDMVFELGSEEGARTSSMGKHHFEINEFYIKNKNGNLFPFDIAPSYEFIKQKQGMVIC